MAKKKKEDAAEETVEAKPEKKNLSKDVQALMKDGKTEHQARQIAAIQSR